MGKRGKKVLLITNHLDLTPLYQDLESLNAIYSPQFDYLFSFTVMLR